MYPTKSPKLDTVTIGAWAELVTCEVLLSLGFEVFRNVAPRGEHDIVALLPGTFHAVPVDTTLGRTFLRKDGRVSLTSSARAKLASGKKACVLVVTEDRAIWEASWDTSQIVYEGPAPYEVKYELFTREVFLRRFS